MPRTHIHWNRNLHINTRGMQQAIRKWMNMVRDTVIEGLNRKYAKAKYEVIISLYDWDTIDEDSIRIVKPETIKVFESGANESYRLLGKKSEFDILNHDAVDKVNKICADMVTNVNEATKQGIREAVRQGIAEGKSIPKIAKEIKPMVGLTEPQVKAVAAFKERMRKKFPKMSEDNVQKKAERYSRTLHRKRSEMIARTETARAQNSGYVTGLAENGIEKTEFSRYTGCCDICDEMHQEIFSLEDAESLIPVHPNCRCAMLPVIEGKPVTEPLKKPIEIK